MKPNNACFALAIVLFMTPAYAQVTGSGTLNTVPLWTGTTTLGNSAIAQKNSNVGIGTKAPIYKLHVVGSSSGPLVVANNTSLSTTTTAVGALGSTSALKGIGVQGVATSTATGTTASGVFGSSAGEGGVGVNGYSSSACSTTLCPVGVLGAVAQGGAGVVAIAQNTSGTSNALQAQTYSPQAVGLAMGVYGGGHVIDAVSGTSNKLVFQVDGSGNVFIAGNLQKASGSFKIDHPLDPANKYLSHSFVESPDMMNIYNGVATLGTDGGAWVTLPPYFEALNSEFRYQLTAIGAPGPNLYIGSEISGNRFSIAGGKPGSKVSWQVTGIRQDAYAEAHRIRVEEDKPPQERGHYLHPELFGAIEKEAIGATNLPAVTMPVTAAAANTIELR
jgi:hypothetical protein